MTDYEKVYERLKELRDEYSSQAWEEGYISALSDRGLIDEATFEELLEQIVIDYMEE